MAGEALDQKGSSTEFKFGMVGAVIGDWIIGMNLTLLSLMGVIALSGVAFFAIIITLLLVQINYVIMEDLKCSF